MGTVRSVLGAVWRGLDGLRKFLHLLILLAILGFVIGALRVAVPRSSCAGRASEIVSNLRNDPQSRPQSRDRYVDITWARSSKSVMPSSPPLTPSSQVSVSCFLAL